MSRKQPLGQEQPVGQTKEGQELGLRLRIRWMIRRDMPEVLRIETASFQQAWSEENLLRCLRQRNCIGMVAEIGEQIVGFFVYELHPDRLLLLNFAVDPAFRRSGVGRQMVEKLISKLCHSRTKLELEVRESNLAAQLFYRSCGFRATKVEPGYYDDTDDDAYIMEYVHKGTGSSPFSYSRGSHQPVNRISR